MIYLSQLASSSSSFPNPSLLLSSTSSAAAIAIRMRSAGGRHAPAQIQLRNSAFYEVITGRQRTTARLLSREWPFLSHGIFAGLTGMKPATVLMRQNSSRGNKDSSPAPCSTALLSSSLLIGAVARKERGERKRSSCPSVPRL